MADNERPEGGNEKRDDEWAGLPEEQRLAFDGPLGRILGDCAEQVRLVDASVARERGLRGVDRWRDRVLPWFVAVVAVASFVAVMYFGLTREQTVDAPATGPVPASTEPARVCN